MTNQEWFEQAGILHGHTCPGLAFGVRASLEADRILQPEPDKKTRWCIAERRACWIDGIQWIWGTTLGNGHLEVRLTEQSAFNFYDLSKGKGVRLCVREPEKDMSREEKIRWILTAPAEQIFRIGEPAFPVPEDPFG